MTTGSAEDHRRPGSPEERARSDDPRRIAPADAPGLADESVNSSRRAGPEADPGTEDPAERAKVATAGVATGRAEPRRRGS